MQLILDLLVSLVSMVVVGQFLWAMRFHFVTDKMQLGARMISAVGLVAIGLFLFLLFSREQPLAALVAGLVLELAASALFLAAIKASRQARLNYVFDPVNPRSILTSGPYRHLRHPFYTSYLMLWIGWALATWSLIAVLPVAILSAIYVSAALGEERKFAGSALAGDYAAYKRQAGFFWPRFAGRSAY